MPTRSPVYRFAGFEYRPGEGRLLAGDREVELQPKVHEALELFLRRPGELVAKEELLATLWPNTYVGEEVLTQVIHKLRHALDDDARSPRILQTVLRRGYRFLPEVVPAESVASPAAAPTTAPDAVPASRAPAAERRRRLGRRVALAGLGLGVVSIAWLVLAPPRPQSLVPGKLGRVRLTATPEREQEAVFSPDGRTYAYASYDARDGSYDLYAAALAGSAPLRLTGGPDDDTYPQFSPDGTRIAFNRRRGGAPTAIWSVASLGGNARLLVAKAGWPTWSPDGREIAFVRHKEGGIVSLHRRNLASGAERELASFAGPIASLRWAPRGDHLAFTDERALWLVPGAGGQPRQVGPPADYVRSLAWEPTGEALICDASWRGGGANDLWRVRLAGGAPEPLMAGRGGTYHPDVSPSGEALLYVDEHKVRQLWVVRGDGSEPRPLRAPTTVECVAWSPDRSLVAFDDWQPRPGEGSLVLLEMGGGDQRQLGMGICPTFSADGRALAFLGGVDRGLWTLDLASGQRRRALADAGVPGFVEANHRRRATWSPDGAHLAYPTRGRRVDGLATVERATGRERLLFPGEFSGAAWSPDGRWIAAPGLAREGAGLYLVEATGGRGRRLSAARPYNSAPIWSPDSGSVYLLVDETRRPRLRRLGLDGTEIEEIGLQRPDDPSFWGIFDVTGDPRHGWLYLLERYEGDLFLLAPRR